VLLLTLKPPLTAPTNRLTKPPPWDDQQHGLLSEEEAIAWVKANKGPKALERGTPSKGKAAAAPKRTAGERMGSRWGGCGYRGVGLGLFWACFGWIAG